MTQPQQPPRDDAHRIPGNYTAEELEFLRETWNLRPRQTEMLRLLLAWLIPKQIAREMRITTKTVRNMINRLCEDSGICDGADGIKEEAAKLIARKRVNPKLHPSVWDVEHGRQENWFLD